MSCNKNYLPGFLSEIEEFKELNNALGVELCDAKSSLIDIDSQHTLDTITWAIDDLEYELGISNKNLTLEHRVEIIKAKRRGQGTVTKEMIINTAQAFSGGEVEVIEKFDEYHFIIYFVGTMGRPENMNGFREMIENIKPAHLTYSFKFKYRTWGEVSKYKWADLEKYTWEQVYSEGEITGE